MEFLTWLGSEKLRRQRINLNKTDLDSKGKAFELFKAEGYSHKGVLVLTPTGLKARGEFEWAEGKLTSREISYGPFQASADTANLEIKSR